MTEYGEQCRAHFVALSRAADFQEQDRIAKEVVHYSCRKLRVERSVRGSQIERRS
jgi:hypothetical protein